MKNKIFLSELNFKIKYANLIGLKFKFSTLNKPELFKDWSTYKSLTNTFNFFDQMNFNIFLSSSNKLKKIKHKDLLELPSSAAIYLETKKDFYWLNIRVNKNTPFAEKDIKFLLSLTRLPTLIKRNSSYTDYISYFFLIKSSTDLKYTHEINGISISSSRFYGLNQVCKDLIATEIDLIWVEIHWNRIKAPINCPAQDYVYYWHTNFMKLEFFKNIDYISTKIKKKEFIILSKILPVNYNCVTILFKNSIFFETWKHVFFFCEELKFNFKYVLINVYKTSWKSIKVLSLQSLLELSIDKDEVPSILLEASLGFFWLKVTFKGTAHINLASIKRLLNVDELPTIIKPKSYTNSNFCFFLIKSSLEINYLNISGDVESCCTHKSFELSTESTIVSSNLDLKWIELKSGLHAKNNNLDYIWNDILFGFKYVYYKSINNKSIKITKKEYTALHKNLPVRYE